MVDHCEACPSNLNDLLRIFVAIAALYCDSQHSNHVLLLMQHKYTCCFSAK
ncbi:hypothetical protein PGB90_009680 [Kerria lacca]